MASIVPASSAPDIKGIFDLCQAKLERNSIPSYVQMVSEIPKTASQKNLGRLLRDDFNPEAENGYRFEDYRK